MTQIKRFTIILIVIGVIGIALDNIWGYNTITYLTRYRDPGSGLWFWRYDFGAYIKNLNNSLDVNLQEFITLPTRQWNWNIDLTNWPNVLTNNLMVVLNWLFFIWNNGVLIFYHVGAWLLSNVLALIGFDMTADYSGQPAYWLISAIQYLRSGIFPYL